MGLTKYVILISIAVLLASLFIHELSPKYSAVLMKSSSVRNAVQEIHSKIRQTYDYIYPKQEKNIPKTKKSKEKKKLKLFTNDELSLYNGREGSRGLYLAIMGRIYNVKQGKQHYGPDGGYGFFAGRDGSRAFVSGDFSETGLVDDIAGLTNQDYIGLSDWVSFYEKDYKFVGLLIGRYYDNKGEPTEYFVQTQKWITAAFTMKESENVEKKLFPPCNSEWSQDTGGRVWCTNKSGGVDREWVGVPRKLKIPGKSTPRCACIRGFGPPSHDPKRVNHNNRGDLDNPNLHEYEGCEVDQPTCINK